MDSVSTSPTSTMTAGRDIHVANDSTAATLCKNQKNGTFKDVAVESGVFYSPDSKPQAGMGVSIEHFNRERPPRHRQDQLRRRHRISLPEPRRGLNFDDRTYLSGIGINTRYLGWGVGFFRSWTTTCWPDDLDLERPCLSRSRRLHTDAPYAEHDTLYRNLHRRPV